MALLIQALGSALILASFVGAQLGRLTTTSRFYLVMNTFGSAGLAVSAVVEAQWGFLVLESVWFVVSVHGLYRLLAGTPRVQD
jgi:hypothetical protein